MKNLIKTLSRKKSLADVYIAIEYVWRVLRYQVYVLYLQVNG